MSTRPPILDLMVAIVTSDKVGLFAVELAGEVIAADAAFNSRVSEDHGPSGHGTVAGMMAHIRDYEREVERIERAWSVFLADVDSGGVMRIEPHEALERALEDLRRYLRSYATR